MKLLEMGLGFEVPLLYNKQERNFNPKEGDMMEKRKLSSLGRVRSAADTWQSYFGKVGIT